MPGLLDMPSLVLDEVVHESHLCKRDLKQCSLTCVALSAFATKAMYRIIPDLSRFLNAKLIPMRDMSFEDGIIAPPILLSRPVTQGDWECFSAIGKLVRDVTYHPGLQWLKIRETHPEPLVILSSNSSPIFPALRRLKWDTHHCLSLIPFLHYTIRELVISWPYADCVILDISRGCPNLTTLELSMLPATQSTVSSVCEMLSTLEKLTHVSISETTVSVLHPLSRNSRLGFVKLVCRPSQDPVDEVPFRIEAHDWSKIWPNLTWLDLEIEYDDFIALLPLNHTPLESSPLSDLRIELRNLQDHYSHGPQSSRIFHILAHFFPSLETLDCNVPTMFDEIPDFDDPDFTPPVPELIDYGALSPLIRFSFLSELDLSNMAPVYPIVSDKELGTLLRAWPELEDFRLPNSPLRGNPAMLTKLSLRSLLLFPIYCPKIRVINALFNAYLHMKDLATTPVRRFSDVLWLLEPGHSSLPENLIPIITFLGRLLPRCEALFAHGTSYVHDMNGTYELTKRWKNIRLVLEEVWNLRGRRSGSRSFVAAVRASLERIEADANSR
ncbi:hypothetical protein SISSUDRAFT_1067824 [Sistotremastrum suecicum HHB10207 ss-3]|uniref:F-box domain-containing protein n=1 Tax=Sistotremastrum suecicum HHB10207 ss-3 TaxID=1314776 RepID=A0A165WND2_9AGAM|nr:hypothetical protein SISSUDRAFT_1067824 [Sistotremastrum suecicum HHB10207 ss-3]